MFPKKQETSFSIADDEIRLMKQKDTFLVKQPLAVLQQIFQKKIYL